MNCSDLQETLMDLARSGERKIPAETRNHLDSCPACRLRLGQETGLLKGLSVLRQTDSMMVPGSLETRLLVAFRSHQNETGPSVSTRTAWFLHGFAGWRRWAAGIAAILLIAMGWSLRLLIRSSPLPVPSEERLSPAPARLPSVVSQKQNPAPAVGPERSPIVRTVSRPSRKIPRTQQAAQVTRTRSSHSPLGDRTREAATDYFLLTPIDDTYPSDFSQIVRIRMPRSGLARLGLPIDAERIDQPVTADVMLTREGMIKAVRFIK